MPQRGLMRVRRWLGILAILAIATVTCQETTGDRGSMDRGGVVVPPLKDRCQASSVEEAKTDAPFELIQPQSTLASPLNLVAVWSCPGTVFVLEYPADLTVWESLNDLRDPEEVWDRMARSYEEFSVGEINGIPASFASPVRDAIGGVDFVSEGVRYTVSGNGEIPLSSLIDMAKTMPVPVP